MSSPVTHYRPKSIIAPASTKTTELQVGTSMMDMLAPYMPSMQPGMGYNSFLQETCMADAVTVGEASRGPQSTNYSCKLVENYRDIFSSQHISPGAVIKHGLASVSSRFSFFSQKKFGEGTLNYVITSSIRQRHVWDHVEFQYLKAENRSDRMLYGDCFIRGFIEGTELMVVVSLTAKKGINVSELQRFAGPALGVRNFGIRGVAAADVEFSEAVAKLKQMTSSSEVSVVAQAGGVQCGELDLEGLPQYLARFDESSKLKLVPTRLFAVLTRYRELRSFNEASIGFKPLDYQILAMRSTTYRMLDAYLEYQLLYSLLKTYRQTPDILVGGSVALSNGIAACENELEVLQTNVNQAALLPESDVVSPYMKPSEFNSKFPMELHTVTVYAGEAFQPHRCLFSRQPVDHSGWTARTSFKAYLYPNICGATVRVSVAHAQTPHRTMVQFGEPLNHSGWKEILSFYVFEREQEDSELVSIGEAPSPHRCMVSKDTHLNFLGWTEKLHFWVPK
ncbi:hypothetical protein BZA05DRAFT_398929 [Tricharina praecox]|uniref:uncharacterized protein n=1 Tax=Tricharina praecox TaxID=43433 RepID=UPI0022202B63|nr:uncharacterized protein BZA05DRAFT_398929 [Tricharina praecox]KAI5850849.1 hypothetical protein BZA05DRAFT_398929 [Tricharina praecox]